MLVRRKTVVHRRRAPACDGVRPAPTLPCGCYLHLQTTVTKSATRQCGRRCATYGKTLRQDTAVRHYGKAIRQALRKDSPEDTADTCGKAQRQNIAAGITARRHHDKTLRQKYTAALWQESATCVMALRHATATKPKKEGVGGGVHDALRVLVIKSAGSDSMYKKY